MRNSRGKRMPSLQLCKTNESTVTCKPPGRPATVGSGFRGAAGMTAPSRVCAIPKRGARRGPALRSRELTRTSRLSAEPRTVPSSFCPLYIQWLASWITVKRGCTYFQYIERKLYFFCNYHDFRQRLVCYATRSFVYQMYLSVRIPAKN